MITRRGQRLIGFLLALGIIGAMWLASYLAELVV